MKRLTVYGRVLLALVLGLAFGVGTVPAGNILAGTKVTICHNNGKTEITVSENAITGHFDSWDQYDHSSVSKPAGPHGDYKGPCVTASPTAAPTDVPPSPTLPPVTATIPVTITVPVTVTVPVTATIVVTIPVTPVPTPTFPPLPTLPPEPTPTPVTPTAVPTDPPPPTEAPTQPPATPVV